MPLRTLTTRLAAACAAAGLVIAGLTLLLRALWLVLAAWLGGLWAHVILGGALAVVGLLTLWLALRRSGVQSAPPLPRDQIVDLVTAFLDGVAAGRQSRRDHR